MRRRRRRWFRVFLVILAGAGLYAYFNQRQIILWFANRGNSPVMLDLRHAAVHWDRVNLSGIVFKLRGSNEEVFQADSAVIEFSWAGLRQHRLGAVMVKKPRVRISDRLLNEVRGTTVGPGTRQKSVPWSVKRLIVIDGGGELDLASEPLVRFSFAPELRDLQLGSGPQPATAQQSIALENVELLSRGAKPEPLGKINQVELRFSLNEAEKLNFDQLRIRSPSFHLSPDALKNFAAASVQTNQATRNAQAGGFPNLRFGKVVLEDGELFIEGFGETVPEGSLKFGMTTEDLQFGDSGTSLEKKHAVQIWDVRLAPEFAPLAPFAFVDSLQIEFSPRGLLERKEIAGATLTGMTITMGQAFRSLMNAGTGKKSTGPVPAIPSSSPAATPPVAPAQISPLKHWKLRELAITGSRVTLADLGVGTTSVSFDIETTLKDVPLSLALDEAAEEIQQQEIADFTITSPLDSFAPVFTMKSLFVRYSIAGLLRREVEEVQILNPTIYVGEDLFWYFDALSKREGESESATGPTPVPTEETGWKLKRVGIAYGQLVISNNGQASLPLPLQFTSTAENLDLGRLSDLKLALDLKVPQEDYLFPGYQLELRQLGGDIRFDLPPETGQNNLVQTLRMKEARWRQFRAEEGWLAVTFDRKGINGEIGAKGYGGYLNGGFTSFFGDNSPWVGWLSGTKVDLKKVTDVMAPGSFTMDGPADFKLEAAGSSSHLERIRGSVRAVRSGKMRIGKLDQLVADIPRDWYWLKREGTRILLETLRDFSYDNGDVSFWYLNDEGNLKLTLRGPTGSRNIDVVLHGAETRDR